MFGFIIMILVLSSLMGNQAGARRMLGGIFAFMAIVYGIRIILFTGIHLIPVILIIWAVMNIAVPFFRGFISSFRRS